MDSQKIKEKLPQRKPNVKTAHVQKQEQKRESGQLTLQSGKCHPKWLKQTDI